MNYLTSEYLTKIPHIKHGFFTRNGGVSAGVYGGLNAGYATGDNFDHVNQNRQLIANELAGKLVTVHQVHSADVMTVTADNINDMADVSNAPNDNALDIPNASYTSHTPKADAMVTDVTGVTLGVLTADCVPVLLACTSKPIIGAAHAGWQGALTGVVENTVQAMMDLGAEPADITLCLGPSIQQKSYEVAEEFAKPFLQQDYRNEKYFAPTNGKIGHMQFSLSEYLIGRIMRTYPTLIIENIRRDTYTDEDMFFSHRRACHVDMNNPKTGRQMSAISLK